MGIMVYSYGIFLDMCVCVCVYIYIYMGNAGFISSAVVPLPVFAGIRQSLEFSENPLSMKVGPLHSSECFKACCCTRSGSPVFLLSPRFS